ncbi:MAG: hypothetical protein ACLQB1_35765 [Streptosporangiaceae bacterium]
MGSATTGHIVTPKLVLVALRQIRENRLGQDSVVLPPCVGRPRRQCLLLGFCSGCGVGQ